MSRFPHGAVASVMKAPGEDSGWSVVRSLRKVSYSFRNDLQTPPLLDLSPFHATSSNDATSAYEQLLGGRRSESPPSIVEHHFEPQSPPPPPRRPPGNSCCGLR